MSDRIEWQYRYENDAWKNGHNRHCFSGRSLPPVEKGIIIVNDGSDAPKPQISKTNRRQTNTPLTGQELAAVAEEHFGETVQKITAPGGKSRDSHRIHFADRTVISSNREHSKRRAREILLLSKLSSVCTLVPKYLGMHQGIIFQEDVGGRRLTSELNRLEGAARDDLVRRAFDSLWEIQRAAVDCGVIKDVLPVAISYSWLKDFVCQYHSLSASLQLEKPRLKENKLVQSLTCLPIKFIKWDARPGNASVAADGRVRWFDWEHGGRRSGCEDFAFLMADEFWPLSAQDSLDIFHQSNDGSEKKNVPLLIRYSVFQSIRRLKLIHFRQVKHGWVSLNKSIRYDRIGVTADMALRLAEHGGQWAAMDPLTEPLVPWFEKVGPAIAQNEQEDAK